MDLQQLDELDINERLLKVQAIAIDRGNELIGKNLQIILLREVLFEALDAMRDDNILHARAKDRIRSALAGEI